MKNLHAHNKREYPIDNMCALLGRTKQAFYKYNEESIARRLAKESFALQYILEIRKLNPGIGAKKLWRMYRKEFPDIDRLGRDHFESLIARSGLNIRKKIRKPRTTDSTHGLPTYPNLVKSFIPTGINQMWVTDITYVPILHGDGSYYFCYLSLITDAYSHEIIGHKVGNSLEAKHSRMALEEALKRIKDLDNSTSLIHHSDRGIQYVSKEYVTMLNKSKISISMTENGDPKENAIAERINSTIKNELLRGMIFHNITEVEAAVGKAVDFYNTRRPHMSLDMMTPAEAAQCNGEIKKWWKSYREEAIKNGVA